MKNNIYSIEKIGIHNSFYINIGGFNLRLNFCFNGIDSIRKDFINRIKSYLSGFILSKLPNKIDYTIYIKDETRIPSLIRHNQKDFFIRLVYFGEKFCLTFYHIGIIQFQVILIKILNLLLAKKNGFIIHCSGIVKDKKAIIFLGPPRSGKSTIIKLLKSRYKIIADDSAIIRLFDKSIYVFQTPFIEKNYWFKRSFKYYSLGGIYFLKKSNNFRIYPIKNLTEITQKIMPQISTEPQNLKNTAKAVFKTIKRNKNINVLAFQKSDKILKFFEKNI